MKKIPTVLFLCAGVALIAGCQNVSKQENVPATPVTVSVNAASAPLANVETASAQPANAKEAPSLSELLARADAVWVYILQGDNISAGRRVDDALAAAEALLAAKDTRAIEYFRRLTVIAPLQVEFRFRYANLCAAAREESEGRKKEAMAAYQLVLKQAETDEMINTSAAFLGVNAHMKLPTYAQAMAASSGGKARICLVGAPGAQQWLLHEVGGRLRDLLRVDVCVDQRDFVPRAPDRDGVGRLVKIWREHLPWDSVEFQTIAESHGVRRGVEVIDQQIIDLVKDFAHKADGRKALESVEKQLDHARTREAQWLAGRLITNLSLSTPLRPGARVLTVALVPQDIYADGNNFMFGAAQTSGDFGVVSYHRFAAEFTGETPKRERLVTRVHKQMLSSIGFMLGVPRCIDPMCARAYPASLEEHDSKGDKLCSECRAGFARVLGHELGE